MEFITAKKKISIKRGDKSLEIENTRYKEFSTIEEAIQDAGSEENLLRFVNKVAKDYSAADVRTFKGADTLSDEDYISNAAKKRENWSISSEVKTTLSNKEKAEKMDEISSRVETNPDISREELLELLKRARS